MMRSRAACCVLWLMTFVSVGTESPGMARGAGAFAREAGNDVRPAHPVRWPVDFDRLGLQVVVPALFGTGRQREWLVAQLADEAAGATNRPGRLRAAIRTGAVEVYAPVGPATITAAREVTQASHAPMDGSNFLRHARACRGPDACGAKELIAGGPHLADLFTVAPVANQAPPGASDVPVTLPQDDHRSSLALLDGIWESTTAPAGLDVVEGRIEGGELGACTYRGAFSVVDARRRVYAMKLVVSDCGDAGRYEGHATLVQGGAAGAPDLVFQVDDGELMLSALMRYAGAIEREGP